MPTYIKRNQSIIPSSDNIISFGFNGRRYDYVYATSFVGMFTHARKSDESLTLLHKDALEGQHLRWDGVKWTPSFQTGNENILKFKYTGNHESQGDSVFWSNGSYTNFPMDISVGNYIEAEKDYYDMGGETGPDGPKGDIGPVGIQGKTGEQGETGNQGIKGSRGEKGYKGETGYPGEIGEPGIKGKKGNKGIIGDKGDTGVPGQDGSRGDTGPEGNQGGAGPNGDKGEQGDNGPKGDIGPKGDGGADGFPGQIGDQGAPGIPGDKGPSGIDTEKSVGPRGIQGPRGPTGDSGSQGPQGIRGFTGNVGPKGSSGASGPTGDSGLMGDIGAYGRPAGYDTVPYENLILSINRPREDLVETGKSYNSDFLDDGHIQRKPTSLAAEIPIKEFHYKMFDPDTDREYFWESNILPYKNARFTGNHLKWSRYFIYSGSGILLSSTIDKPMQFRKVPYPDKLICFDPWLDDDNIWMCDSEGNVVTLDSSLKWTTRYFIDRSLITDEITNAIIVNKSTVLCQTLNMWFITTDSGKTWTEFNSNRIFSLDYNTFLYNNLTSMGRQKRINDICAITMTLAGPTQYAQYVVVTTKDGIDWNITRIDTMGYYAYPNYPITRIGDKLVITSCNSSSKARTYGISTTVEIDSSGNTNVITLNNRSRVGTSLFEYKDGIISTITDDTGGIICTYTPNGSTSPNMYFTLPGFKYSYDVNSYTNNSSSTVITGFWYDEDYMYFCAWNGVHRRKHFNLDRPQYYIPKMVNLGNSGLNTYSKFTE